MVLNEYIPAANEKISQAAQFTARKIEEAQIPAALNNLAGSLTPEPETIERVQQAATAAVETTAKELENVQKPAKKKKGLLIFAIIAAAGAAAVAAWRASKPIDDPWKTPAPVEPTTVRANVATETPASVDEVREQVAKSAAEAKDHAKDAVKEATAGAKETLVSVKEELTEAASAAKHKAEEAVSAVEDKVSEVVADIKSDTPKPSPRPKK